MRQGRHARTRGLLWLDAVTRRGRTRAEEPHPHLLTASHAIGEGHSQADPQGRPPRLAPRLTAAAVRRPLSAHQGDADAPLPPADPIGTPWHERGYSRQKVATSQPPKTSRQPPPSSTTSQESSRRPRGRTRCDASRWMPRRPAPSVRSHGGASAVSRPAPPTTIFPQRRPGLLGGSSCRRWRKCCCLGAPPQGPVPVASPVWRGGGRWGTPAWPTAHPGSSTALMARSTSADGPTAGSAWWRVPPALACRCVWLPLRPRIARTSRWSAAGASWQTTGTVPGSTRWRPCSSVPRPCPGRARGLAWPWSRRPSRPASN